MSAKKAVFSVLFMLTALIAISVSTTVIAADDYNEGKNLSNYNVTRTTGTITFDGKLDEADWKRAEEFVMVEATKGGKAPLKTTMRLLWDDKYLYIAYYCEDPDAWATWENEDDPMWDEEVVEFFIDPVGTGFTYYEHEINPINQKVDLFIINSGKRNNGKFTAGKTGISRGSNRRSMSRATARNTAQKINTGPSRSQCRSTNYGNCRAKLPQTATCGVSTPTVSSAATRTRKTTISMPDSRPFIAAVSTHRGSSARSISKNRS